ncbi:MAG TPA: hypothetical protein VLH75_13380, partial [Longimicrobiales bacterium]|nr:hypothetical protein [Longimicrobiales bacterium]
MSEHQPDPFAVDMELLRRMSVLRAALEGGPAGAGAPDVSEALASAAAHARRSSSPVLALLEVMEQGLGDGLASDPAAACFAAADEVTLTPGDEAALGALAEAVSGLMAAWGAPSGRECEPGGEAESGGEDQEGGAAPWSHSALDDAAAFLVEMDPESAEDAARLAGKLAVAGREASGLVADTLRRAADALAPALKPRARKAARSGAVADVSALVEAAVLLLEAEETGGGEGVGTASARP